MKENYQLSLNELKQQFGLHDWTDGLTNQEAQRLLDNNGPNAIEVKPTPKWKIFLRQYNNIVIYILLAATLLTILIGHYTDAIVIAAVVVLNSLIGYFQETSAANALAKIKEMMAQHATVYRDGQRQDINATDLVVGDVVFLEAGDNVPADLRIVSADNLRIEESSLTGETNSVIKTSDDITDPDVPLADRVNMAFASTSVTSGSGLGIVVATAEQTEIGKISQEVAQIKAKKTPLTKEIDHVGKVVSYIMIVASVIIFVIGFFLKIYSLPALALAVVAMLVGAIPEGLPAITSVILAFGISKMAKLYNTIIKSMPAVETLGSVDVIATDKTGTLTKNEMSATELWVGDQHYDVTGNGYAPVGKIRLNDSQATLTDNLKLFLEAGYQANDTSLIEKDDFVYIDAGTTTELLVDYIDQPAEFVTNGIGHARKLAMKGFRVHILGGEYKLSTEAMIGIEAVQALAAYHFTKAFLGTNGISIGGGYSTPDTQEACVKGEAVKKAYESYILADHTKFNMDSRITFARLEDAKIITDQKPEQNYEKYTVVKEVQE